jgi:hypothetical protein
VVLLLLAGPVWATDRWVNINGGNDGNSCSAITNQNTPKQHINNGISCLQPGDRLRVMPGVYNECIDNNIPSGPSSSSPTILISETMRGAILRPSNLCSGHSIVFLMSGPGTTVANITLDGFVIDGTNFSEGSAVVGIEVRTECRCDSDDLPHLSVLNVEIKNIPYIDQSDNSDGMTVDVNVSNMIIRNTYIHDIGIRNDGSLVLDQAWLSYGIYFAGNNGLIENTEIANCSGWGIHEYHSSDQGGSFGHNNIFRNNFIHDSGAQGILNCFASAQVYNNIIARNGRSSTRPGDGIAIGGSCSGANPNNSVFYNNTVVGNSTCIEQGGGSGVVIRNNICYQNGGGNAVPSGTPNLTGSNPLFVNSSGTLATHFQLQSGSPAHNTGANISLSGFTGDFGGNARIQEGTQDQGAWEFGGSGPVCPQICCVGSCPAGCPINCPVQSGDPIAFWQMEEGTGTTVTDSSGNNHTLTLSTGPGPTFGTGIVGSKALACAGDAGFAESTGAFTDANYTWMMWLQVPVAPNTTSITQPVRNGSGQDSWGFSWSHTFAPAKQAAYHQDSSGNFANAQLTSVLQPNQNYHIATTYDGTNLRIYLNGQLQATTPVAAPITPAQNFHLCGLAGFSQFAGLIDQVKIWNRTLSAAEITTEYGGAITSRRKTRHRIVRR